LAESAGIWRIATCSRSCCPRLRAPSALNLSRVVDLLTAAGVRVVVRDLTVKQIGQLLGRAVGTPINGLVIERAGHELSVCLWRVGAC
jgi:hypothetical protein